MSNVFPGPLGLHKHARSDEGPKALFVGECVGRTSRACHFQFTPDWVCQWMSQAMNCVKNLQPEQGDRVFIHRGKGKEGHELNDISVDSPFHSPYPHLRATIVV